MTNLISILETIIGPVPSSTNYAEIARYAICGMIVILVVSYVMKGIVAFIKRR